MILALVLFTMMHISTPPESLHHINPTLTPISLTTFPSQPYRDAYKKLQNVVKPRNVKKTSSPNIQIPTLKNILVHYLLAQPVGFRLQDYEDDLQEMELYPQFEENIPFYLHYPEPMLNTLHSQRRTVEPKPRVMYLTAATLIVVPGNLLHQWDTEINNHCQTDIVRHLVVRDKPLPPASELASKYDVRDLYSFTYSSNCLFLDYLDDIHK